MCKPLLIFFISLLKYFLPKIYKEEIVIPIEQRKYYFIFMILSQLLEPNRIVVDIYSYTQFNIKTNSTPSKKVRNPAIPKVATLKIRRLMLMYKLACPVVSYP